MIHSAAKTVLAWALGMVLAFHPALFASVSLAVGNDAHPTTCRCGGCAKGCTCCVKPGEAPAAPTPAPAIPVSSQMQDWAATVQVAAALSANLKADTFSFLLPLTGVVAVPKVPLFTRDCAFLI
jgi:hypothetical protein